MNINHTWLGAFLFSLILQSQAAYAVTATASEFKAMEPVCQAIGMGGIDGVFWAEALNKPDKRYILDKPENAMAKDAQWFHHYCWGKLEKLRYFSAKNVEQRNYQIKRWRGEMGFIIDWTSKHQIDWQYTYLIHKEIAESYLYDKNYPKVISEAELSLKQNRDFAGAYILISDAYIEIKNNAKALEYVTEGLTYNPDSKALKSRYKALGGKLPYPQQPAPTATAPEKTQPAAITLTPSPEQLDSTEKPLQPLQTNIDKPDTQLDTKPAGNPYCRFCP